MKLQNIFPPAMLLIVLILVPAACENYDDDPVFPASDFIAEGDYRGAYFPTEEWRRCDPKEVGMDPRKLKEVNEEVRLLLEMGVDMRNLLIIRDGYIVAEQYYSDAYGPDDLHRIYSCTKSLVSACVGIAVDRGLVGGIDQGMLSFFPDREIDNLSPEKEAIKLEHLLTMSAGLDWEELAYPYGDSRNTYRQWSEAGFGVDFVLDLPMIAEPGAEYSYSSGVSHVLSAIVGEASGMRTDSFALENIFKPLGIRDYYWPVDKDGVAIGGSAVRLRPRDMARFGYLYLNGGKWEDQQILPAAWVEASGQAHIARKYIPGNWYGYQFWVSGHGYYSAVGFGGQWIMIHPALDLLMVCNNAFDEGDATQWNTPERLFNNLVIPACED